MPEITEAQVASVLRYGAWRSRRTGQWHGRETPISAQAMEDLQRLVEHGNPATIAARLNGPLRECERCEGAGGSYPLVNWQRCPTCNGTGTIDPERDLRAFLLRVATERAAHCVTPATCDDPSCEHARALVEALS